jgi:hypothetical protein
LLRRQLHRKKISRRKEGGKEGRKEGKKKMEEDNSQTSHKIYLLIFHLIVILQLK